MRLDFRLLLLAFLVALIVIGAQSLAQAAEPLQLTEVRSARFPERAFVLTLPDARAVRAEDVQLTENGVAVDGLGLSLGDGRGALSFGTVLVIDASLSMRGEPIADAMEAARAFAAQRRPEQPLGIVFFSGEARVALQPTTDAARIDAVLAAAPELTLGTRIYDATRAGADVLDRAGISAGSIVLLSDGADGGSTTSAAALGRAVGDAGARVYSVGLRSARYDGESLREIAALGRGTYAEAATSSDLAGIFDALGERLGNQYVVRYRSQEPLGARVEVQASVAGVPGFATATYQAPTFQAPGGADRPEADTLLTSRYAPLAIALLVSALIGALTFGLLRGGSRSVRSRISGFLGGPVTAVDEAERATARKSVVAGAGTSIRRSRWWAAFEEQVHLARIEISAGRLTLWTALGTLAFGYMLGAAAGPGAAVLALVIPAGVWFAIRFRVTRERRAFADQLPENLQVLASAMRAGHSFLGALAVMVDDAGEPSRREFKRVLTEEQLGTPVQDALAGASARMQNPDVEYVGLVAQLQSETGGNTAEVLDRVTETIRERNALHRLVRTLTAQGRLGGWVVSLLPVALVLAMNLLNPGYLDPLLESTGGRVLLAMGGTCIVAGMLVIRRIVDIKV